MASTNSYDFTVTRDQLITDSLLHIAAIGEGETPTAAAITEAARILNMMVKLRAADGMPLWALKRGTILPFSGASSITTQSHIVSTYVQSTLSASKAAAATVLAITSTTGMNNGDVVGIELDTSDMYYTTIVSVDSSTQITITAGLPSASGTGNRVITYTAATARIGRPLRIIEANVLNLDSTSSWEIQIEDRGDYFSLGNRTTASIPNRIYYDPSLGTATADPTANWYGQVYVYPRFHGGDHVIEFTYHRPFQDFDASTDTPDFPQEFYLPLMLELAALQGPKYGVPPEERKALFNEAMAYRQEALYTVQAEGSLSIQPWTETR